MELNSAEQGFVTPFFDPPDEVLLQILSSVPRCQLGQLATVCKQWERVASDSLLWRVGGVSSKAGAREAVEWQKRLQSGTFQTLNEKAKLAGPSCKTVSLQSETFSGWAIGSTRGDITIWDCASGQSQTLRAYNFSDASLPHFFDKLQAIDGKRSALLVLCPGEKGDEKIVKIWTPGEWKEPACSFSICDKVLHSYDPRASFVASGLNHFLVVSDRTMTRLSIWPLEAPGADHMAGRALQIDEPIHFLAPCHFAGHASVVALMMSGCLTIYDLEGDRQTHFEEAVVQGKPMGLTILADPKSVYDQVLISSSNEIALWSLREGQCLGTAALQACEVKKLIPFVSTSGEPRVLVQRDLGMIGISRWAIYDFSGRSWHPSPDLGGWVAEVTLLHSGLNPVVLTAERVNVGRDKDQLRIRAWKFDESSLGAQLLRDAEIGPFPETSYVRLSSRPSFKGQDFPLITWSTHTYWSAPLPIWQWINRQDAIDSPLGELAFQSWEVDSLQQNTSPGTVAKMAAALVGSLYFTRKRDAI